MRLTMAERRVLIKSFAPRYRKKGKKVKGEVLTEFTQMTGYNRCYGAYLLRHQGKRIWLSPKVVALGDVGKKGGGQRARKYDQKVVEALKIIWKILDYLVWPTSGRHFARSGAHFTKRWGAESGCQHTRAG